MAGRHVLIITLDAFHLRPPSTRLREIKVILISLVYLMFE